MEQNQKKHYKEEWDTHLFMIQYRKCEIEVGKQQETIFEEKENQLDIFIFLDQNLVRPKVICWWGHFYNIMIFIMPPGLEDISTK